MGSGKSRETSPSKGVDGITQSLAYCTRVTRELGRSWLVSRQCSTKLRGIRARIVSLGVCEKVETLCQILQRADPDRRPERIPLPTWTRIVYSEELFLTSSLPSATTLSGRKGCTQLAGTHEATYFCGLAYQRIFLDPTIHPQR